MKIRILFIALLFSSFSWAQFNVAAFGTTYTQDFNTLTNGTWTNNTTLTGWYAKTDATASITTYVANTGTSTTANLNAYGVAGINPLTDRALGISNTNAFTGGSGTGKAYYGWRMKNTTGATISSLTVTWTGEQWRRIMNTNNQSLILSYQTAASPGTVTNLNAGTWTAAGSTFTTPQVGSAAAVALDGNDVANRVANITVTISVTLAANDEIMLRWEDLNDTGNDHLMAIDDVSVVANGLFIAVANGDWANGATWNLNPATPTANSNVLIPSPYTVYLSAGVTRNSGTTTTVDSGATLATANTGVANSFASTFSGTTTINGTFKVEGDSFVTGANFTYGAGASLNFNNTVATKSVPNTSAYWPAASGPTNVNVVGDISLGATMPRTVTGIFSTGTRASTGVTSVASSILTLNGTIRIDAGGQFANAPSAPIYGASSTLIYNTASSTTLRSNEWAAAGVGTIAVTQGYPNNVQISNNTTVRYNSAATVRAMNGNLTIDTGSTFDLTTTGPPANDVPIAGAVTNNGTFKFSTAAGSVAVAGNFTNAGTVTMTAGGGTLRLAGNFSNSGTFTGANRTIFFTKTGTQTVASSVALTFPFVQTTGSPTTIQLLNDLTISASGGAAITYGNASDIFDINGQTLTIGTFGAGNTISGSGSFKGSTTSNLYLKGTTSIGTLKFANDLNLGTFTMERDNATVGCVMGSALTINTALVLTRGIIDLGANTMTLASTCSNTFTASGNSYVVPNVTAGGILRKAITATGTTYNFPIGDITGTFEYSPASVNYTSGTVDATSFLGLSVEDAQEPNFTGTDYLSRYWSLTNTGTFGTPVYNFTGTYTDSAADVTGAYPIVSAFFKSNQWDGTDWLNNGAAVGSGTLIKNGCTLATGTNHITGGILNQEIDIRGSGNIIVSGATTTSGLNGTAFGTKTVGSSTTNTFRIHNRGGLNLTIGTITISGGINPADFTITALPSSPVAGETFTDFSITFIPSTSGYRWAVVTVPNNDSNENPYTFVVDGTGQCAVASTNTITPTSGPPGTEVTITAATNNLYSATATLNGVSATVSSYSPSAATATVIKVIVPTSGATSGQLTTTNNIGCQATNYFTVLDNAITSCEGSGTGRNKIFISEITDHGTGSHSFVELYNATGSSVSIAGYTVRVYYNGGSSISTITIPAATNLANNTAYVIGFGGANAADVHGTYTANQTSGISGINSNDNIRLFDATATQIDQWGSTGGAIFTVSSKDYTYRRKNTGITAPSTTWNSNDWVSFTPVDYTDIGKYDYSVGTPPTITQNLTYTATCKTTTLTVNAIESYTGAGNVNTTLTYKWFAVPNASNVWSQIADGGIYSGATTNILTISDISSITGYQFYCQIMDNPALCYISSQAIKITPSQGTTWQVGNTWSNGVPTIDTAVIIDNDYDTSNGFSPSFDACSVTINSAKTVTIRANDFVNIRNDLTVTGNLNVENNGSLVMIDDNGVVTNTGTTQVKRTATGIRGFDYVYWSSPVLNQSVDTFYSTPAPGYKYQWNPLATNVNSPISSGTWQPMSGTMSPGSGYIVRGSSAYGLPATSLPGIFTGKVNSGIVPVTIQRGTNTTPSTVGPGNGVTVTNYDDNWNLIGNPYPSSIKAVDFLTANTNIQGFVYLWTHGNAPAVGPNPFYSSFVYNYTDTDYITYNSTGTSSGPGVFNGYIAAGQGFFIMMNDGATTSGTVNFKNSMRSKTYSNSQFYKTSSQTGSNDTHRIWLDIVDANNVSARTLIGYVPEATLGLDRLYDAFKNTANDFNIYSLVENQTLTIQGRPSPFDSSDIVPIGVRIMQDGAYKIAIGAVDGLFSNTSQNIYLEDKQLGIVHDLRESPYAFNATAGVINDRFVLRYNGNALGNPDFEPLNAIALSSNHGEMVIKSSIENIQEVTVFDMLGRQLFEAKSIENKDFTTSTITISQQALIVKIKLGNGTIVTRKIVL